MPNPSVFIGSSSEHVHVARAIQDLLQDAATATVWQDDSTFRLNDAPLESLLRAIESYDFAVMVMGPDDVTVSRTVSEFAPRDNVLFELGLFMGRLGRERTYVVLGGFGDIKIPSDLKNITFAIAPSFDARESGIHTALGPACNKIRDRINELGLTSPRDKELAVLYRLLNACTPLYPDVAIDVLKLITHRVPESFNHLQEVADFLADLLKDYVRPLLTDSQMRSLRVYFSYYLGDGVAFGDGEQRSSACWDTDADDRDFPGEFVIGISNPEVFEQEGWRIGRAIPGFDRGLPLSNCAQTFLTGGSSYKNDLRVVMRGQNFETHDEKSVYTVPVRVRSHQGAASVGVVAVSSRHPNSIPDPLKVRVELLANIIGYLFSLFAVNSMSELASDPDYDAVGQVNGVKAEASPGGEAFTRRVVELRRAIASHFESQFIHEGIHTRADERLAVAVAVAGQDVS